MSKCCKCIKWLPHNWLCLKGISISFIVLFYITLVLMIGYEILIYRTSVHNVFMWYSMVVNAIAFLVTALSFLTVAKFATALRKIKKAVAPCCCEAGNSEDKKETAN